MIRVATHVRLHVWMSFVKETPLPWTKALPTVGMLFLLQTVQRAQQNQSNWFP